MTRSLTMQLPVDIRPPAVIYPAYRERGDRPREYLLDVAACVTRDSLPITAERDLIEDLAADYLMLESELGETSRALVESTRELADTRDELRAARTREAELQRELSLADDQLALTRKVQKRTYARYAELVASMNDNDTTVVVDPEVAP